jgi:acyl carrier protein
MSDTRERVKKVTANVLKMDAGAVGDTARFTEDLGGDSVQAAEWIAMLEFEFDVEMDPDQAQTVKSIADAVAFFERAGS